MSDDFGFEQHTHEAVVHTHRHWHVTHNWSDTAQTFEHLASQHEHEHDHAELAHAHFPHQDFASEHLGEAHEHYHADPTGTDQGSDEPTAAKKTAARKATAKKATAKKSTAKKSTAKKST